MKIGITYDLRTDYLKQGFSEEETAEFDKESTIENIEESLQSFGYDTYRIGNIINLVSELRYNRWDMVFNICEGMYGIGREAQVPALLDAYQIPYTFSDPFVLSLTLNKGMTKRIIRDAGIKTAPFFIVKNEEEVLEFFMENMDYPLFVKPNTEGSGKGIYSNSKVNNSTELWRLCKSIWKNSNTELIIESYLPGREFTIGIIGTGEDSVSLGCMEIIFNSDEQFYSYNMKTNYENNIIYKLPEQEIADKVCRLALKSWKVLGCRDAGRIDIRLDENDIPNFIEVNPLAGLNKETSDLPILAHLNGFDYDYIIENIINSAKKRML
jgi:D-alanine-D-alanine ligase